MTSQVLILEDGCLAFTGEIQSDDFFLGLQRIGKGRKVRYRKNKLIVSEYPEQLDVLIRIGGADCNKGAKGVPPALMRDDSGTAFKFDFSWREAEQAWPAESSLPVMKRARPSAYTVDEEKHPVQIVEYRFSVHSKGVPLVSRLVVRVVGKDGRQLAEISGGP